MSAEFVLRKDKDGTFNFVFQTENGQVLLTSGSYCDPEFALRRLHPAHQMARKDRNYKLRELRNAEEGGFYFVVKNRSQEVLAHSPLFPDQESRRQGMILTRGCSHGARVENLVKEELRKHSSHAIPTCPKCGSAMKLKVSQQIVSYGEKYWGCPNFPECTGKLEYNFSSN
jgi:uncharacterized protein YegP (UPF0339 family)